MLMTFEQNNNTIYIPNVTYKHHGIQETKDLYSALLRKGILFIDKPIDYNITNIIIAQLLFLDKENFDEITIYVNTPGGDVACGLAIYDTLQNMQTKVNIVCYCIAYSLGALLLCTGTKGRRSALPNSSIMFHQPIVGTGRMKYTDFLVQQKFFSKSIEKWILLMEKHCKVTKSDLLEKKDDWYMTPEEALELNVIDFIEKRQEDLLNINVKN